MDILQELTVGCRSCAFGSQSPAVVAIGRYGEHAAHETHQPGARMLLDEGERHLGISAKMPIFFCTLRSIRARSSSRRKRAISAP